MATLEKIRSKSVFLIIVIGVALLAFIVGDALTNGRNLFGDGSTVAKIGNQKIDIHEYQQKREELNRQLEDARKQNPEQFANFDTQLLPQMALEQLVGEKLLDNSVEKAGIRSSSSQLRYYMIENPANQNVNLLLQQLNANNIQVSTPAQAYEIIFNPKRNGLTDQEMAPFQRTWIALEEETKQIVKRNTYTRLLYGTVKANELDKKALYNDYVETKQVALAFKPYGQLDEKKYPVSDAEIKEAYNKDKNDFKIKEPTKEIAFIAVSISPSDADRKNSKALALKTVSELRDSNATLSKDLKKEGIILEKKEARASDLASGALKDYVMTAGKDSVKLVEDNFQGFKIVKMGRRYAMVDSIQLNIIQVVGKDLPKKVLARLNTDLPVDSIFKVFSQDSVAAQRDQWIPLFTEQGPTNAIEKGMLDTLLNAGNRFIELSSMPQGSVLAQVVKKNAPVEIYEFEEVNYTIKPSVTTINGERNKLEKFLAANNTAKKFRANALKAGYTVQDFNLTQSSPAVPRMAGMNAFYPESRQVVRWVMIDGEEGDVSHIYENNDPISPSLYVAAIDAEYEDFVPVSNKEVKELLTDRVRRSKAGDAMLKQYKPKATSMAAAAAAMGVQPQDISSFRFGRNYSINDNTVMGRIAGSNPGKVIVLKGDDGVYAYQVKGNKKEAFPYSDANYEQQYYQIINPDLNQMLIGNKKIDNRIYKFEAGD